jgi:hypothetical protein
MLFPPPFDCRDLVNSFVTPGYVQYDIELPLVKTKSLLLIDNTIHSNAAYL